MTSPFRVELLTGGHDRAAFDCGEEPLNRYFRQHATQDMRRRITNCFVAVAHETGQVAAYYTLAAAGIPISDLPEAESRKLPRYPTLPAVRIGRLAVDRRFQGRGLGGALLADAAARISEMPAAVFALLVDAKNDAAVAFYRHHGFLTLASAPRTLFVPLATARTAFLRSRGAL